MDHHRTRNTRPVGWLLLIFLTAIFLRFYDIADTPPGLTHDEADHGITAWEIVNGARQIYFTIGYGREPLFDYSTAALMSFIGPTFLAGRLTAVFFSLLLIAAQYAWVRRAFDRSTAIMAAAGLAVGFWAVMSGRQSLRSITLPTLFVLSLYFYWRALPSTQSPTPTKRWLSFVIAACFLGLAFYTYIPARILWFIFPLMLAYLAFSQGAAFRRTWPGTVLMLLLAAGIGLPLFYYLYTHPTAELRIAQLSSPLVALLQGNPEPIWTNIRASLGLVTISGDPFWRYNIAGRPWLPPVMGALFYLGLLVSIWRILIPGTKRQHSTAHIAALLWLLLGLAPVLITGPELSMTQAIGMQPTLYLFPAIGMTFLGQVVLEFSQRSVNSAAPTWISRRLFLAPLILFSLTAALTARSYFIDWAKTPEVRVQYESTMVTAMRYLNHQQVAAVAVSTITPGRFHSPAVAQMTLRNSSMALRWFDGRSSLILPADRQSLLVESGFAPLSPQLAKYQRPLERIETIALPKSDPDQPLNIYQANGPNMTTQWLRLFPGDGDNAFQPVRFGEAADFLGYDLDTALVRPGEQIQLVTLWQVKNPLEDALLFTHVQDALGLPIAQADQLSVPGHSWHPGDLFIQLHQLELPGGLSTGSYPLVIGLCQQTESGCQRLPIESGPPGGDLLLLTELSIIP